MSGLLTIPAMAMLLQSDASDDAAAAAAGAGVGMVLVLFYLAFLILMIASVWKIFVKAGQPGWAAIVPIYNNYVLVQIARRPIWVFILTLIPCLNLIPWIILSLDLAQKFGKSVAFGIGIMLLFPIFLPILAFGDARYQG